MSKTPLPSQAKLACPTCKGTGEVLVTNIDGLARRARSGDVRNQIRELGKARVRKMSLRNVAKAIGREDLSPQSIKHHVGKIDQLGWDFE